MKTIQWFPGHMAKARREATEKINLVDIVIELVDARLPESSRNPIINEIIGNKPRIIVLNKMDMADGAITDYWLNYYQSKGIRAMAIDAQHNKGLKQLQTQCREIMQPYFDKKMAQGVKPRAIRLIILGIPNVGKSTLINRFVGKNQAQTGNKPGVTKAQRWLKFEKDFELLDTPGILWPKFEDPQVGLKLAASGAIKDQLLAIDEITLYVLDFMKQYYPQRLLERYQLTASDLDDQSTTDLFIQMTAKFGYQDDYEQMGQRILHDFRQLNLGRVSLDRPNEEASHA
ncbi:ribosome biogenesis GTPase YlqF [Fundicoccus culcitae]|uniref:Ribosome biogenesis GTPase A n=1 Tax=Fundicoccus culcitae TaxID=2969821 RepID=A0ABY5P762_9LACT|nr:ribosome biogenesis GTPase YlqF [Fundicoccus culcitae]UUX34426.1 ribosome biogenesis GTPase YlqF [Fundicoccus culcitae]